MTFSPLTPIAVSFNWLSKVMFTLLLFTLVFPSNISALVNSSGNAGCTNEIACNYQESATVDDGSCILLEPSEYDLYTGSWNLDLLVDCFTLWSSQTITFYENGTVDILDPNFGLNQGTFSFCGGNLLKIYTDNSGIITLTEVLLDTPTSGNGNMTGNFIEACVTLELMAGCTDDTACNYNPMAGIPTDTCLFGDLGCTDIQACNYNLNATCDDGSCIPVNGCGNCNELEIPGCTDITSCSYLEEATCDDNSCEIIDPCGDCGGAGVLGCTALLACNYNPAATCDDGLCVFKDEGTMDLTLQTWTLFFDQDCSGINQQFSINYLADGTALINSNELGDIPGEYSICAGDTVRFQSLDGFFNMDFGVLMTSNIEGTGAFSNDFFSGCVLMFLTSGCTDESACNYNDAAGIDDGSCIYGLGGCLDPLACNFNPGAICDDGSCEFPNICGNCNELELLGCTDPSSCTFIAEATCDDGSCLYMDICGNCGGNGVLGCTTSLACNYNPDAACDDGSCVFIDEGTLDLTEFTWDLELDIDCSGNLDLYTVDFLADGSASLISESFGNIPGLYSICVGDTARFQSLDGFFTMDFGVLMTSNTEGTGTFTSEFFTGCVLMSLTTGCTDQSACNYDSTAGIDDGSCLYGVSGCTDNSAVNYNPSALCSDGLCLYAGCTNPIADNYNVEADLDDGSCILITGCTYLNSYNYNPEAVEDDGSCLQYCSGDFNGDGSVTVLDLTGFLSSFGENCSAD